MISHVSYVMTLANSIIGVSVLAMPFCFKQCGIILSILMLLLSSTLSKLACHFLVKSAVMSRRRNFEFLAFHAFGYMGKFMAELSIIGFLMGTCIAFFVVVGDLGPQIVGKIVDKNPADIRTSLLVTMAVFIVLPLGLLRNVDSLSSVCIATILFYLCLVLKIMMESLTHMFTTEWYDEVYYWQPSGILQCLPIFSMALFCQTQLFEIYETLPNVSLEKMNYIVDVALNICTVVYICVGFFGYVTFRRQIFTGNILMSFEPNIASEAIKIGFVLSVAFSFPLVIFPCRASLNSLLFRWAHSYDTSSNYIPETRFRWLTIMIVVSSLIIGILIPSIEFVLGLVGSTIGVMICLMFPAAFFISISSKNTNERLLAQAILFIGVWIMILGTYANLYAMEESANAKYTTTTSSPLSQLNNIPLDLFKENIDREVPLMPNLNKIPDIMNENKGDIRQEPPIPVEQAVVGEKKIVAENINAQFLPTLSPALKVIVEEIKKMDHKTVEEADKSIPRADQAPIVEVNQVPDAQPHRNSILEAKEVPNRNVEKSQKQISKAEQKTKQIEDKEESNAASRKNENLIHSDAIKKEESELAEVAALAKAQSQEQHDELLKTLEKHKMEQQAILLEQKEIIETMKQKQAELEREKQEKLAIKKSAKIAKPEINNDNNIIDRRNANNYVHSNNDNDINHNHNHNNGNNKNVINNNSNNNEQFVEKNNEPTMNKSRGPILNALVKQSLNVSTNTSSIVIDNKNVDVNADGKVKLEGKNAVVPAKIDEGLAKSERDSVPIPLAMGIDPKQKVLPRELVVSETINEKVNVGRDILETEKRNKREVVVQGSENTDVTETRENVRVTTESDVNSFVKDVAKNHAGKECAKTEKSQTSNDQH